MEIIGSITTTVHVDPIVVLRQLKENELQDTNSWITERDGKYYRVYDYRNWEQEEEITKEIYDYVLALNKIIEYLRNKEKQ